MAMFSSVESLINSVVTTIGSIASSIGSALANAVTRFLKVAGPYLEPIGKIVGIIANVLAIKKEEEGVDEIGAKAMMSDKKPEDFDSYNEYIEYLRNDIKLDKERFEKAGKVEKMAQIAVGATVLTKGIEEKKGFDIPTEVWVAVAKLGLEDNYKEVNTILDTFKDGKLEDFARYVDGKLGTQKEGEIGDMLVDMYRKLEPNASSEEIEKKVIEMDRS